MDTLTCIGTMVSVAAASFGIGYKLCPKATHKPTITSIKRECPTYSEHSVGRNRTRRFEVTLSDGHPATCNCPKLVGSKCTITQESCLLL